MGQSQGLNAAFEADQGSEGNVAALLVSAGLELTLVHCHLIAQSPGTLASDPTEKAVFE